MFIKRYPFCAQHSLQRSAQIAPSSLKKNEKKKRKKICIICISLFGFGLTLQRTKDQQQHFHMLQITN